MNDLAEKEEMTVPKRGRPKGAGDKVPRKRKTDLVAEQNLKPGDNSKITLFNFELMNLREIDRSDRKQVEERIIWYFKHCIEEDVKPGMAGLCLALGISRDTWSKWGTGRSRNYQDIVFKSRQTMESIMEQYMLNGKINPVTGIFLLKNNFGYSDKSEVVLTPNQPNPLDPWGEGKTAEQLRQKYLESANITNEDDED